MELCCTVDTSNHGCIADQHGVAPVMPYFHHVLDKGWMPRIHPNHVHSQGESYTGVPRALWGVAWYPQMRRIPVPAMGLDPFWDPKPEKSCSKCHAYDSSICAPGVFTKPIAYLNENLRAMAPLNFSSKWFSFTGPFIKGSMME